MAYMNRRPNLLTLGGFQPGLLAKIGLAVFVCATVRVLLAQAPAPPAAAFEPAVKDDDGRGYKVQVPFEAYADPKNRGKLQTLKNTQIRGIVTSQPSTVNDPQTKATLDRFFQQYFFPMWTTEEGLKTIADDRRFFLQQYVQNAKDQAAHSYLINVAFTCAQKIVQDNYHPASRYNAMLLISSLNDVELSTQGAPTVAEPMRTALQFILQQFQKEDNPDLIKLAALLGLSRHLELDNYRQASAIPAALKTAIIKELTALAEAKEAPDGRSPEAHTWMRRRAIEALGMACLTKPDEGVATTLDALLKDETEPLSVRDTVASTLGKISLQAPVKIDAVPTAKELGYLALFACDTELTRAENFRKSEAEHEARLAGTYSGEYGTEGSSMMPGSGMRPGGMPGMPGGVGDGGGLRPLRQVPSMPGSADGGYGGYGESGYVDPSMMDPKHYRVEYLRRRIRQHLYAVQLGLTGGEDRQPSKPGSEKAVGKTDRGTPTKGVWAVAKGKQEQDAVDDVYFKVRKLIETLESAGPEAEFYQLKKDMRKDMTQLEAITRRLPPPGAAPGSAGVATDDETTAPAAGAKAKAKAGKTTSGKGSAVKAPAPAPAKRPPAPAKPAPGKSASRPPALPTARPQPTVFGRPQPNR